MEEPSEGRGVKLNNEVLQWAFVTQGMNLYTHFGKRLGVSPSLKSYQTITILKLYLELTSPVV
jgi:hypothetical protein